MLAAEACGEQRQREVPVPGPVHSAEELAVVLVRAEVDVHGAEPGLELVDADLEREMRITQHHPRGNSPRQLSEVYIYV